MPFASSAFGQLRYIVESTPGTTPVTGNGVNLRMTGPTMKAAVGTTSSNEIAAHRMASGLTTTDMNLDGGFNFELSGKEYDPFLESLLGSTFTHFGVAGLGAAFSMVTTATTITASVATTGASIFTALPNGSWIKIVPPVAATAAVKAYFADRWFKVATTTATVITLDASTPITGVGIIGATAPGYAVSQSTVANGASLARSFTLEYAMTDINQFLPFRGMRANSMDLSLDVGSIITGSFGFMGQRHDITQASVLPKDGGNWIASKDGEVMNSVTDVGIIAVGGVNLLAGGTSFIRNISLEINNNLRGQKAVGVFGNAGVGYGEFGVSGSMEVYFQDETLYKQALEGTNTTLAFGVADFTGAGYLIELDKIRFNNASMNPGGKDGDMMVSLPIEAFYRTDLQRGIRITRARSA